MKDKEKQIKEIMNDIKAIINTYYLRNKNCDEDRYIRDIAKTLLEKYQPKLPEDSVVLSREEYEMYKTLDMFLDGKSWDRVIKDKCKETAEKFVNLPKSKILTVIHDYEEIKVVELKELQELAKQFGVEKE